MTGKSKLYASIVALVCFGLFLYQYSPETSGLFPPCLFHKITGFYCHGCGTARALHALLHGRISDAISYNATLLVLLPAFFYWYGLYCLGEISMTRKHRYDLPPMLYTALLALVILFGALRNVPIYPLCLLAP